VLSDSKGFEAAGQGQLNQDHLDKIRSSALSDQQIWQLGWRSLPNGRLEIPYRRHDGTAETCHDGQPFRRWRLSDAEIKELKRSGTKNPGKYRSPSGNGCRLYHSALALAAGHYSDRLADRFEPLRITEGELKTEAANAHDPDRLTIGLGGVSSWRDRYDGGDESRTLVDWDEIPLQGRQVRLCFDSDLAKPQVAAELRKLAEFLAGRGAQVLVEVLPHGLDGTRLGIDDLIYRHGAEAFQEVAAIARSPFKVRRQNGEEIQVWTFNPEPADTRQRAAYLVSLIGRNWRRSSNAKDAWQRWTGTHWQEVQGDDEVTTSIEDFARLQGWQNRELTAFRSLQACFRRSIGSASERSRRGLLPFRNGVLVLDDMRLIAHDPAHGNTWSLPYDYNPATRCPGIEALLLDRLGDADSVALFRAFARSLITGDRLKCFLEITGPSNTGKSVLANMLTALVGGINTAAGKLHRLEDASQRFETLKLKDKRLAVFSECQDYSGQLQVLKSLTGDDSIAAEIKGGRHLDFTYRGGVVLVGNGPVRASDPTGAVLNRRRSLAVTKVVLAQQERQLLDPDGAGGWRGELVAELPGLVNWCLAMTATEAKAALARDIKSKARIEAELEALLSTDILAEWANRRLVWAGMDRDPATFLPLHALQVGTAGGNHLSELFPSYLAAVADQGANARPLTLRVFKAKLVDLLRDTLGLDLPAGNTSSGDYRTRGLGSTVPGLRWRLPTDDAEGKPPTIGAIAEAFLRRLTGTDETTPGTDRERIGNGKTPVGNGWNGWNGSEEISHREKTPATSSPQRFSYRDGESEKPVPSVPSIPHRGSCRSAAVPETPPSVPEVVPADRSATDQGHPIAVDGETGWRLPGALPPGKAPTNKVLVVNPHGASNLVERSRITQGTVKPPANRLTIQVAPPTLRELIAQAQADGLADVELVARVQGLAIAAGLEQPFGAQITMAATVMARSNG
jgi:phage/plasmid-associated DNA primase